MNRRSGSRFINDGAAVNTAGRFNRWKLNKKDLIFLGILAALALGFLLWFLFGYRESGNQVEITVDGALYGTYDLEKEQEIPIEIEGKVTNILSIQGGEARMTKADCPDQICVRHAAISHVGENIVCLPNRVVAAVVGEEEPQMDSVAQ